MTICEDRYNVDNNRYMSTSNGACQTEEGKNIDRQSLTYVVRRRHKTKSSCVVGSLGTERMNVIRRLGVVNLT